MIIHLKRRQVLSSILSIISSIASWSSSLTESFNMLSSIMLVPSSFFTVVSNHCKTDEPQTCSRRCGLARQTNRCQRILIGQRGIQAGGDCFGKSFNNVILGDCRNARTRSSSKIDFLAKSHSNPSTIWAILRTRSSWFEINMTLVARRAPYDWAGPAARSASHLWCLKMCDWQLFICKGRL